MTAPRVLLVSGDFPPFVSGVGDYVDKLAAALHDAGTDVTVLTSRSVDPADSGRPFRVLRTIESWGLSNGKSIIDACRGYDIVHLQYPAVRYGRSPMINLLPAMLRMAGVAARTLLTIHDFRVMRWRWRARVAPIMWAVDGLVHVDEKDWPLIRPWGVRTKPRAHIPIAANAQPVAVDAESRKRWRRDLGLGDNEMAVAFFGILYPHKGLSELLGAVHDLRQQGRQVRLLVLGDFDRQADWRPEMERMLADPAVRWVQGAPLDEVSRCLHAADLAALPFHSGASTNRGSLLSALAHGLPTVTTNGPATPPGFEKDFGVLLVPVKDRSALGASIGRLMDDAALRQRMRHAALARHRSWAAIAVETVAFYARLTESRTSRTRRIA